MIDLLAMASFVGFVGGVVAYHLVVLRWAGRAPQVQKSQRRGYPSKNNPRRWQ